MMHAMSSHEILMFNLIMGIVEPHQHLSKLIYVSMEDDVYGFY